MSQDVSTELSQDDRDRLAVYRDYLVQLNTKTQGEFDRTLLALAGGVHTTPAMAAGVADHVWKLEEVVGLLEAKEGAK